MKRRHIVALSLVFLVPFVFVLALAASALRDRQERTRIRAADAAARRLDAVALDIANMAEEWDDALYGLTDGLDGDPGKLRGLADNHPWVRQAFWLDGKGHLAFPDAESAGLREKEFLDRSELLFSAGLFSGGLVPTSPESGGAAPDHGWSSYWWREGSQWVFWRRIGDHGYVGLELNRYALLADLSARLEPAIPVEDDPTLFRLLLGDDKGAAFAVWGSLEPDAALRPLATLGLAVPFSGWTLSYHLDKSAWAADGKASLVFLLVGVAGILLAALALGIYAWRGFADELRVAGQRVSFVNQVSHELKTPLTNIRLYAELLAERLPEGGTERDYLDVIEREGRRLSRLINNVLTFGREARGTAERLVLREGSVDDVLRQVLDAFRPTFSERGIEVRVQLNAPDQVMIDTDLVDQVTGNLLSNAEKYAASGRLVEIETGQSKEQSDGQAWIRVRDLGPGIKSGDRSRLFRQFERFHTAVTDAVGGTGLGLYLSRTLARRHGGDLVLEGTETGCSFLFTFKVGS